MTSTTATKPKRATKPVVMPQPTQHIVVWPGLTVVGEQGSRGVFYQGDTLRAWDTATGDIDKAAPSELRRLLNLGAIEQA